MARLLRAGLLLCVAATLPVLSAPMTAVTLVIVLATVACYPMLVNAAAGRLVTMLAVAALVLPLLIEIFSRRGAAEPAPALQPQAAE